MDTTEQTKKPDAFKAPNMNHWYELEASDNNDKLQINKAQDDLKNMLLASLQMQHLVVLAGSGCSISAGGPSMQKLWSEVVGAPPKNDAQEIASRVNYKIDDKNIETFLSKVEAFLQVNKDKAVCNFLKNSKKIILDQCSSFLNVNKLNAHKIFLHRLSRRRIRDQRLQVFTTNYDICFERAAAELGGVALDGFSFISPRRYDPRFFRYDIIRRPHTGEAVGHYLEGVFLLNKLHGSVNWARSKEGTIYEKDTPTPGEACLIYPAMGKYQQSFDQPYLESLAQYLTAVREPNTCILVVGFGFNDNHLSEPLLAAVESNPHLRLIVVDSNAMQQEKKKNRFWNCLFNLSTNGEDIWFINMPFNDFANIIPDLKSLTPADTLMKAIKDVTREP